MNREPGSRIVATQEPNMFFRAMYLLVFLITMTAPASMPIAAQDGPACDGVVLPDTGECVDAGAIGIDAWTCPEDIPSGNWTEPAWRCVKPIGDLTVTVQTDDGAAATLGGGKGVLADVLDGSAFTITLDAEPAGRVDVYCSPTGVDDADTVWGTLTADPDTTFRHPGATVALCDAFVMPDGVGVESNQVPEDVPISPSDAPFGDSAGSLTLDIKACPDTIDIDTLETSSAIEQCNLTVDPEQVYVEAIITASSTNEELIYPGDDLVAMLGTPLDLPYDMYVFEFAWNATSAPDYTATMMCSYSDDWGDVVSEEHGLIEHEIWISEESDDVVCSFLLSPQREPEDLTMSFYHCPNGVTDVQVILELEACSPGILMNTLSFSIVGPDGTTADYGVIDYQQRETVEVMAGPNEVFVGEPDQTVIYSGYTVYCEGYSGSQPRAFSKIRAMGESFPLPVEAGNPWWCGVYFHTQPVVQEGIPLEISIPITHYSCAMDTADVRSIIELCDLESLSVASTPIFNARLFMEWEGNLLHYIQPYNGETSISVPFAWETWMTGAVLNCMDGASPQARGFANMILPETGAASIPMTGNNAWECTLIVLGVPPGAPAKEATLTPEEAQGRLTLGAVPCPAGVTDIRTAVEDCSASSGSVPIIPVVTVNDPEQWSYDELETEEYWDITEVGTAWVVPGTLAVTLGSGTIPDGFGWFGVLCENGTQAQQQMESFDIEWGGSFTLDVLPGDAWHCTAYTYPLQVYDTLLPAATPVPATDE